MKTYRDKVIKAAKAIDRERQYVDPGNGQLAGSAASTVERRRAGKKPENEIESAKKLAKNRADEAAANYMSNKREGRKPSAKKGEWEDRAPTREPRDLEAARTRAYNRNKKQEQ